MNGEWIDYNGYDWYLTERVGAGASAIILIDYGTVDEPTEQLGVLPLFAEALRLALARPVETGSGQAGYPEVEVQAHPSNIRIEISGESDTVEAALGRLAQLFETGDLPLEAQVPEPEEDRWLEDRAARTGINGYSLSGKELIHPGRQALVPQLMRHLSPAAGACRTVIVVDDRTLVGAGFTRPGPGSQRRPHPQPAQIDLGADPRHRAGSVRACYPTGALMSAAAPYAPQSVAAFHLLAGHVTETMRGSGVPHAPAFSMAAVGDRLILEVSVGEGGLEDADHVQLLERLVRFDTLPSDASVAAATDQAQDWLGPLYEPMCHLTDTAPDLDLSTAAVLAAYRALARTIHLIIPPRVAPLNGYPLLVDDLPAGVGRTWRTWNAPKEEQWTFIPSKVSVHKGVLTAWRRRVGTTRKYLPPLRTDLNNLAVKASHKPTGAYVLVDTAGRLTPVHPGALRGGAALRKRIEQAGQGLPPTILNYGDVFDTKMEEVGQQLKFRRAIRLFQVGFVVAVVLAILGVIGYQVLTRAETATVSIPLGETATLPNGTTVRVYDQQLEPDTTEQVYTYSVDFCAGEDISASNAESYAQRYVSTGLFGLRYNNEQSWGFPVRLWEGGLEEQVVPTGECVTGRIGFTANGEVSDGVVRMTTEAGDEVTWTTP